MGCGFEFVLLCVETCLVRFCFVSYLIVVLVFCSYLFWHDVDYCCSSFDFIAEGWLCWVDVFMGGFVLIVHTSDLIVRQLVCYRFDWIVSLWICCFALVLIIYCCVCCFVGMVCLLLLLGSWEWCVLFLNIVYFDAFWVLRVCMIWIVICVDVYTWIVV